jgi:hypothetical protein
VLPVRDEELEPVTLEPKHLGQIDHLHEVQARLTGLPVDHPNLLGAPILLSVAFVNNEGLVKGGEYLEAIAEFCMIGVDPDCTDLAILGADAKCSYLKSRGIRWVLCAIPRKLQPELGPKLEQVGFVNADEKLAYYKKDLREK